MAGIANVIKRAPVLSSAGQVLPSAWNMPEQVNTSAAGTKTKVSNVHRKPFEVTRDKQLLEKQLFWDSRGPKLRILGHVPTPLNSGQTRVLYFTELFYVFVDQVLCDMEGVFYISGDSGQNCFLI